MAAESVGQIGLDLVVNKNQFDKQMTGIQGLAKKAAKALAGAFAVKKLIDFGKECLNLGSDLAEVQNVVDVTFPHMTKEIDTFAKSAAKNLGLSETMAKQYTGTYGAMAKAFGFTENQAYDMSTALTALTGDVASFYNLSQNEAYTKLKSVFTGETESLKDLGVVMTQTALDSYALANGFGKTTAKMSEAEKVALRYQFVQEQLSLAAGDFSRTADGWANQVRILNLQFDSLKATIGQGLINVFTPVIKVINTLLGRLMTLANAFKSFTEIFAGKKDSGAVQMQETADAANQAAKATEGIGDAAASASKKMKGLYSFDAVNTVEKKEGEESGGGTGGAVNFDITGISAAKEETTALNGQYQMLIEKCRELKEVFKDGFGQGIGDSFNDRLTDISKNAGKVKQSLKSIFKDKDIAKGAQNLAESFVLDIGRRAGAFLSVGTTIAQNLTGGIASYLEQNTSGIKDFLLSIFDISADIMNLRGSFSEAFAYIFEAFGSDSAQQITADLLQRFTDVFGGIAEVVGQLADDIIHLVVDPFVDNQEEIRNSLEGLLGVIETVTGTISQIVSQLMDGVKELYEEHIAPAIHGLTTELSEFVGNAQEFWNQYINPILQQIATRVEETYNEHLKPVIDTIIQIVGQLIDIVIAWISDLWNHTLKPLMEWIKKYIVPVLAPIISLVIDMVSGVVNGIIDFIGGLLSAIKDIIAVIIDLINGDWSKAWEDAKSIVKDVVNGILKAVESMANGVIKGVNGMIRALNNIKFTIPEWVPGLGNKTIGFNLGEISEISIPKLAAGGFVQKNTPQLAMIGDNRHQGEIVAPENKLYENSAKAVADVVKPLFTELLQTIVAMQGKSTTISLKVTGEMAPLIRMLKTELDAEAARTGVNFEVVYE